MESLINLDLSLEGLSESAKELVKHLLDTIGWNFTSISPHRQAQQNFIKSIMEREDLSELEKYAISSNARKILKEYENQHDVVSYALSILDGPVNSNYLDEDWLNTFFDGAAKATANDIKMIWGKILKSQLEGDFVSKRLMTILPQMNSYSALAFTRIVAASAHVIGADGNKALFPLIYSSSMEKGSPIVYDAYVELGSLGLIEYSFLMSNAYSKNFANDDVIIHYYDEDYTGLVQNGKLNAGTVIYTAAGQELSSIIETEKIDGYFQTYCLPHIMAEDD